MWRAFFLAVGIAMSILGVECLVMDQAVLAPKTLAAEVATYSVTSTEASRTISPPEWAPWTFLSAGAVVILYSFTVPKRVASG